MISNTAASIERTRRDRPLHTDWGIKMTIKTSLLAVLCVATVGFTAFALPAMAQEKTAKACADEWKADKAGNQAKGITEKAYVEKCKTPAAAAAKPAAAKPAAAEKPAKMAVPEKPAKDSKMAAPAAADKKTAKACEDEWKADKAGNQAKGITEKAYVEKCRAGTTTATPVAAPAPAPAAAAPAAPAAVPAKPAAIAPAPAPAAKMAAPAPAAGKPAGANQYAGEGEAKAHCPSATVVWANLDSKIFHFAGHKDYGHTKKGAYMCEGDATAQGIRAAKDEKHP